jgi:hypothetical protein
MSYLLDIEDELIDRIAATQFSGSPLMATVRGATGAFREAIRDALLRERMPAAYVALLDENTSPLAAAAVRGPRFAVFVATRTLRLTSNPRGEDVEGPGALEVLAQLRSRLDNYAVLPARRAVAVALRFVFGDDRTATYELTYRIETPLGPLVFDGTPLGGSASITTRNLRLLFVEPPASPPPDILVWQGELRASSASALDARIAEIDNYVGAATQATLVDPAGATYPDMKLTEWSPLRPVFFEPTLSLHIQPAEIRVQQVA